MKSTLTALITILAMAATTGCTKDDSDNLGDGLGSHSEDFNVNYTIKQSRSSKRGICGDLALPQFDIPTIAEGVGWYYNWSSNCPSATMLALLPKYDMTFLPMAWNNNYNAAAIRSYKEAQPEAQFLLAYNEPNLTDQANMTPAQAAEKWGDPGGAGRRDRAEAHLPGAELRHIGELSRPRPVVRRVPCVRRRIARRHVRHRAALLHAQRRRTAAVTYISSKSTTSRYSSPSSAMPTAPSRTIRPVSSTTCARR